jgi:hypothetical protein
MNKSTVQINYEKANMVVNAIVECTSNPENIQMYIVREFYKAFNNENIDLAYQIINEAFNKNQVAGYKYLECCERCDRKGEFYDIAMKNPLMNLN